MFYHATLGGIEEYTPSYKWVSCGALIKEKKSGEIEYVVFYGFNDKN